MGNLTGAGDIYEPPCKPEVIIDTSTASAESCAEKILAYLEEHHHFQLGSGLKE